MSFHLSASDIELDDNHILKAKLGNGDGDENDAEIDLDTVIGNSEGSFEWGGENFSHSASDVSFSLEGDDNVPVLRATLTNSDGESFSADINLSERIGNQGGSFVFE